MTIPVSRDRKRRAPNDARGVACEFSFNAVAMPTSLVLSGCQPAVRIRFIVLSEFGGFHMMTVP